MATAAGTGNGNLTGDWKCFECGGYNYANRVVCFKCKVDKKVMLKNKREAQAKAKAEAQKLQEAEKQVPTVFNLQCSVCFVSRI